jgi:hypothetical protein
MPRIVFDGHVSSEFEKKKPRKLCAFAWLGYPVIASLDLSIRMEGLQESSHRRTGCHVATDATETTGGISGELHH